MEFGYDLLQFVIRHCQHHQGTTNSRPTCASFAHQHCGSRRFLTLSNQNTLSCRIYGAKMRFHSSRCLSQGRHSLSRLVSGKSKASATWLSGMASNTSGSTHAVSTSETALNCQKRSTLCTGTTSKQLSALYIWSMYLRYPTGQRCCSGFT